MVRQRAGSCAQCEDEAGSRRWRSFHSLAIEGVGWLRDREPEIARKGYLLLRGAESLAQLGWDGRASVVTAREGLSFDVLLDDVDPKVREYGRGHDGAHHIEYAETK